MRARRKFFRNRTAVVLSALLLFSMVPQTAFAENAEAAAPEDEIVTEPGNPRGSVGSTATAEDDLFTDVTKNDWYFPYIQKVSDQNIMTGYGTEKTKFGPLDTIVRGDMAVIVHRLAGLPMASSAASFGDVKSTNYYKSAIDWASENGIVTGYGNGMFGPADPLTREQFATMLYRLAKEEGCAIDGGNFMKFPDAQFVHGFATAAMTWAVVTGVITGDKGRLNPQKPILRAEAAAMISRFLDDVVNAPAVDVRMAASKALSVFPQYKTVMGEKIHGLGGDSFKWEITFDTRYTSDLTNKPSEILDHGDVYEITNCDFKVPVVLDKTVVDRLRVGSTLQILGDRYTVQKERSVQSEYMGQKITEDVIDMSAGSQNMYVWDSASIWKNHKNSDGDYYILAGSSSPRYAYMQIYSGSIFVSKDALVYGHFDYGENPITFKKYVSEDVHSVNDSDHFCGGKYSDAYVFSTFAPVFDENTGIITEVWEVFYS